MSYGVGAALQSAIFQRLTADTTLGSFVGTNIFDAIPPGPLPGLFVSLGPEEVSDSSDKSGHGATHIFTISVVTDAAGFQTAKDTASAVSDSLIDAELALTRGRLVSLRFLRAEAKRASGTRRIDLKFRARVEDT